MFNNFDLSDEEILKILEDYKPIIVKMSRLRDKTLTKNRKKL